MSDVVAQEAAEEYVRLVKQIKALTAKKEDLEKFLIPLIPAGTEMEVPRKKAVIKGRNRKNLKDDKLKEIVSPEVWDAITLPKTDSLLMKLALRDKVLSQTDVDAATEMTKTWLEVK